MSRVALLTAAALLTLAGCGDDSKSASTSPSAGSPTTEAAAPQTTGGGAGASDTSVADTSNPNAVGKGTEFCNINQELNDTPSPLDSAAPTAAEFEAYFTVFLPEALSRATAAAPPEVAADVVTLVAGMEELTGVLSANEWDLNAALGDPALTPLLNSPDFNAAGDRVDAFCGA